MQRLIFILSLFILAIVGCSSNESHSFLIRPDGGGEDAATEIEVGKTIPAWQEGVMDIHFINTTTGESMFVIFPDGTQMLIDAASSSVTTNSNSNTTNTGIRSRWDPTLTSTRGSQIITDYIRKCMYGQVTVRLIMPYLPTSIMTTSAVILLLCQNQLIPVLIR